MLATRFARPHWRRKQEKEGRQEKEAVQSGQRFRAGEIAQEAKTSQGTQETEIPEWIARRQFHSSTPHAITRLPA